MALIIFSPAEQAELMARSLAAANLPREVAGLDGGQYVVAAFAFSEEVTVAEGNFASLLVTTTADATIRVAGDGQLFLDVRKPVAQAGSYAFNIADMVDGLLMIAPPKVLPASGAVAGNILTVVPAIVLRDTGFGDVTRLVQWRLGGTDVDNADGETFSAQAGVNAPREIYYNSIVTLELNGTGITVPVPAPAGAIETVNFEVNPLDAGVAFTSREGAVTTLTYQATGTVRARWLGRTALVQTGRTFRFRARVTQGAAGNVSMVMSESNAINSGLIYITHSFPAGGGTHFFDSGVVTAPSDWTVANFGFKIGGVTVGDVATISELLVERLS